MLKKQVELPSTEFDLMTTCIPLLKSIHVTHVRSYRRELVSPSVAYAESFHGGFHSVACGGHLYFVCAVCDVAI